MSDAFDDPESPTPPTPPTRQPTFGDLRDDYDDDFGIVRSPREIAKRRLIGPGIAFVAIGSLGIVGMIIAEIALAFENVDRAMAGDVRRMFKLAFGTFFILVGAVAFALVIAAGANMMSLRRRWLALFAAYVVAGLSLAGCYGILFYPFGIWALIVLYRPDVRQEFGHRPVGSRNDD